MKVHQLVHTQSYGDAISTEVLSLQRAVRELGGESEIYAINCHPRHKGKVRDYKEFPDEFDGVVLLHYSLGSPLNEVYRRLHKARKVLLYHNITPPRWFAGVNPRVMSDIEHGLKELPLLCVESDEILADSPFNAREIEALGFQAKVLELPFDPHRWDAEPANEGILSLLTNDPSLHLLHVGRVAPNKRLEDVLKVFYFLHHSVYPQSKLWFVGIDIDTEIYSFSLKRLAYDFRIEDAVRFTGGLSDGEVRAFYEASSVYLCMSEHEGFCLPVVEAMHFGLPVVAYAEGAVPETIADGGIIFREKRPEELAELIAELHTNSSLKNKVIEKGKLRAASLSFERFKEEVHRIFFTREKNSWQGSASI